MTQLAHHHAQRAAAADTPSRRTLRFLLQPAAVGLLLVNDFALMASIRLIAGAGLPGWGAALAPLVGLAVWPWGFLLLDALRLRHRERAGGR